MAAERQPRVLTRLEWGRAWRALDKADRRRITRAVRRGEALDDPRLAALAIGAAQRDQAGLSSPERRRRLQRGLGVFAAVLGVYWLAVFAFDEGGVLNLLIGAFWLLFFAPVFGIYQPRVIERAAKAEQANRAVVERARGTGPPSP